MPHSHRSGNQKQTNKPHKGGGGRKAQAHRTEGKQVSLKGRHDKDAARTGRIDRANQAKQRREQKRGAIWLQKRVGGGAAAPRIALWVPLSPHADCLAVQHTLQAEAAGSTAGVKFVQHPDPCAQSVDMATMHFSQYKQRITFIHPPERSALAVLELAKVADIVILVLPVQQGIEQSIDKTGELMITLLKSQGLPAVVGVTQGLDRIATPKLTKDLRSYGQRFFHTEFPDSLKQADALSGVQLVRAVTSSAVRTIHWRSIRSYMMAESARMEPNSSSRSTTAAAVAAAVATNTAVTTSESETGTLRLTGYIRGRPLGVNQLVHLCGLGQFKLLQVNAATEPCPATSTHKYQHDHDSMMLDDHEGTTHTDGMNAGTTVDTVEHARVLARSDPSLQESLVMAAQVDTLAGEQTWPTEEELADAAGDDTANDTAKQQQGTLRPSGWSTYQATWLEDDATDEQQNDGEFDADALADLAAGVRIDGAKGGGNSIIEAELGEKWHADLDDNDSMEGDDGLVGDLETMELDDSRKDQKALEQDDKDFPDEVDTPHDVPAAKRYARYRALRSFRSSPWDPQESLPRDYAQIYQFDDFLAAQKQVVREGEVVEKDQNDTLLSTSGPARASQAAKGRSLTSSFASNLSHSNSNSNTHSSDHDDTMDDADTNTDMHADTDIDAHETAMNTASNAQHSSAITVVPGHEDYIACGTYVELVIADVPVAAFADICSNSSSARTPTGPLLCFSLLQFEQKLSVLQFQVMKDARYTASVPSKERLMVQCGFRTWAAKPIYSQINLNCDKHKYERFLQADRFSGVSVYGPATFQPAPVFLFKLVETQDTSTTSGKLIQDIELVATGTLLKVDPDHIVLKKIVLTGYPIRVRKRRAVVKHMFRFMEDIKWFKPAELVTKYGLSGHIKEPVGTHGLMKVVFSKHIKQNDTVCLPLYKRVYPKFDEGAIIVR